jgi:dolichyl-diphosphooligosaccharide--protein glycosyltransferase
MEDEPKGWWREHALTVVILLTAFSIAILVRSLWAYSIFQQWGWLYVYGGGSDSYYHSRVMAYIIQNHTNLGWDYGLRYPVGAPNPREPLFDWMNAVLGILFQGFFQPSNGQSAAVVAGSFFLDIQAPLWAGLGVFPVYLLGKEVSSRRMGLIAAMIFPFAVAAIESSALGYANYLTFYTFVMLLTVYAYIRTIKAIGHRRWIPSYRRPKEFPAAFRQFLRYERNGIKWSVFTGVCLGALALSWQGYSFFIAALVGFLLIQMIVERVRRIDSFGLYIATWITGIVGFGMAMPYYYVQGLFLNWFFQPGLVYFGALIIVLPFLMLRDTPWVVSVPVLVATGAVAVLGLFAIDPATVVTIVTGQGYFVKTLVYSTVAEAQAPSFDALILGFGVLTFFLAFVGLALFAIKIGRQKFRREHVMFMVFAVLSVYLPITAAKFFLLGSAVFALLPAEVLLIILNVAGFDQLRRNVASLADRRGQFTSFRKSFKARHVLVLGLVLLILLPNVWYAIDAGVPYNSKSGYNTQIFDTLPAPLRPSASQASSYFLGAAGTSLDTPNQYDEAGYNWLATQDTNVPLPQRPAFVSWWDYGFQALGEGEHPTVADNFQNGIDPAGAFLLSQNESQAIAVLAVELLASEQRTTGEPYLPAGLNKVLASDGVNLAELHTLLVNTSKDVPLVIANPARYLPVDPTELDPLNAMYMATSWFLSDTLSLSGVAQVYDDIQAYTGWSIRYAMVDSRLFPFSGSDTGIFYAPADLTDRIIGSGGTPTTFFNVTVTGSDGNTYPLGEVPANVQSVSYNINYFAPFYNSMIYKVFVGYNGTDIGQSAGIPGDTQALGNYNPEPGWMMQHFQVVYRTAFYCPYSNPNAHPGCFGAENLPQAVADAKKYNGTADTSTSSYYNGGETMLEYYSGQPLLGTVQLPDGTPVPDALVTVYDSWGIPHMTAATGADGAFSVTLPPGNDTVNVTTGSFDGLSQSGTTTLASMHLQVSPAYAFADHPTPMVQNVVLRPGTVAGFVYYNTAHNSTYNPQVDAAVAGTRAHLSGPGGISKNLSTDPSGTFQFKDLPAGDYSFEVLYRGTVYNQTNFTLSPGQTMNETVGLASGVVNGFVTLPHNTTASGATVTVYNSSGVAATNTSASSGAYSITSLGPGNYTIKASWPGHGYASSSATFQVNASGGATQLNLSLTPVISVSLTVLLNGNPVGGFPVRFTPVSSLSQASISVNASASAGTTGSLVYVTASNGSVAAALPLANYTVYGAGLVGSQLYAGLESAYLGHALSGTILAPLALSPAFRVTGYTPPSVVGSSPTSIVLEVYTAAGDVLTAQDNLTGNWMFVLPSGSYTLVALVPPNLPGGGEIAVRTLTVPQAGTVDLPLGPGTSFRTEVGMTEEGGGYYPASGALVSVSLEPSGATLSTVADDGGNASFVVPILTDPTDSFCLSASAYGFEPFERCQLSESELFRMTTLPLSLQPVFLNFSVSGFPSGSIVHVNLTANAPPATSATFTGGPTFSTELLPGSYSVTAWTSAPSGGLGIYRTPVALSVDLPFGYHEDNLTVVLSHQVAAVGQLELPSGTFSNEVTIQLVAPGLTQNVSGSDFSSHFLATPGPYVLSAQLTTGTGVYANITPVTINATGVLSPKVSLTQNGGLLHGELVASGGSPLNVSTIVNLTTASGLHLQTRSLEGAFSITLPYGLKVFPSVNLTVAESQGGVTTYTGYTVSPATSCVAYPNETTCTIPLDGVVERSTVVGHVAFGSYPGELAGSVTFVGPLPGENVTTVPIASSQFSARLLPGQYDLYATTGSGGAVSATVSQVSISFGDPLPLNLTLVNTWTDSLRVHAGVAGPTGSMTVRLLGPGGATISLPNQPFDATLSFPLPVGTWTLSANSTGRPYGPVVAMSASATVNLLNGNAATALTLTPTWVQHAQFAIVGPTSVSVEGGGTASFSFALRNTGNTPVSLRLSGSPTTWNFNFTPENLTLGLSSNNDTAYGEVVVHVPAGTQVDHAPVVIEAELSDGTLVGVATPTPNINVYPTLALKMGPASSVGTDGPHQATVPFYVMNSGNLAESVLLGVADSQRLASIGWTAIVEQGTSPQSSAVSLSPGSNNSFQVLLTSARNDALLPGNVTVVATVVNGSGAVTDYTVLNVPTLAVSISNGTLTITGPSLGSPSPYPFWLPYLAFLPAIAVVVSIPLLRWWRARRWVRR